MLAVINRLVSETARSSGLSDALQLLVSTIQETLSADACCLFLTDEDKGDYVLAATEGLNSETVGKARVNLGEGLVGLVGEREEPLKSQDAPNHPEFLLHPDLGEGEYMAFLGVPIIHRAQVQGVLTVHQSEVRDFAEEEVAFLVTLSAQLGGEIAQSRARGQLREVIQARKRKRKTDTVLAGVTGSLGVAIGKAVVVYPPADLDAVPDRVVNDIENQIEIFEHALGLARDEVEAIHERSKQLFSSAENALFEAYLRILDSRSLMNEVEDEIKEGQWAQGALKRVIQRHVMQFESLDDSYLAERAADFRDLGRRILAHMQSSKRAQVEYPKNTVLVSDEVTATAILEVPQGQLVGVMSGSGSSNSHVAILANALGLPAVMGVEGALLSDLAGLDVIVDGYHGQVYVSPSAVLKKEFRELIEEEEQFDDQLQELRDLPAETTDGACVSMLVNTGLAADGGLSLSVGAEGIGLYRTEMPFMVRDRFPSEAEQKIMYRQLLNTFNPRPVVMRTLDIGGDKQLSYFSMDEENPFLGWRGVRVTLDHPDIFLQQLRAMLQANAELNNLSIMLPMITSVSEVEKSLRLLQQAFDELTEEGANIKMPPVGIMVEVPSAVYQAYELAKRVDFISVGTNDLIQYLLAVDRNNSRVAQLYDGLHPAVLRALADIAKAVHRAGKRVSICGELASDPLAVPLLLGMGYDGLSMSARSLLRMKWVIRQFSMAAAKELTKEVLAMDDVVEVRCHMEMVLDDAGLGGLIRAGA